MLAILSVVFFASSNQISERLLLWKWGNTWAVCKGKWKLTNTNEQSGKGRPSNVYIEPVLNNLSLKLLNLSDDPGERKNLANSMPEKVKKLKKDYNDWCSQKFG